MTQSGQFGTTSHPGTPPNMARSSLLRRPASSPVVDLDRLVLAGDALRQCGTPFEVANLVAPVAAEVTQAAGATVHLECAGRRLQAVRFGATPDTATDTTLELVVADPAPGRTSIVAPTSGPVRAALTVHDRGRPDDPVATNLLTLLAQQVGATLDRLSATTVEPDRLDPLTGVGNRQQAVADVASVRPGDAILLIALDESAPIGTMWGLASFVRSKTRPPADTISRIGERQLVVVLRDLKAPVDAVADRLLKGWRATEAAPPIVMGAAVHGAGAPLETLDWATAALASARSLGRDRLHVAADLRVPTSV